MNYIVLDLEWNQCPEGKEKEKKQLPFEIIEIGAVKLNDKMEVLHTFHRVIKPQIYKQIHFRTKEVIHMEAEDLKNGVPFEEAARSFIKWCGKEYTFCTWGSMDLVEFQRNLKFYKLSYLIKSPGKYYDIQKIFSIYFEDGRSRKNLEYAVGFLNIEKDHTFHRAFEDAFYTSMIMKYMDPLVFKKNYSIDFFNNPKTRKDEIYVVYEGYSKFISKEFKDKELAMADREVVSTRCYQCNKNARKKIRWFTSNTKLYYCLAYCEEHGFIKGTISMKKAENGNVFCVKKIKLIDDQETKMLQEKREMLREKKRIKKRKLRVDLKV